MMSSDRPRQAPNRLIVLPPSHYCERARWGLDAMAIPFLVERWAVGPLLLLTIAIGVAPRALLDTIHRAAEALLP